MSCRRLTNNKHFTISAVNACLVKLIMTSVCWVRQRCWFSLMFSEPKFVELLGKYQVTCLAKCCWGPADCCYNVLMDCNSPMLVYVLIILFHVTLHNFAVFMEKGISNSGSYTVNHNCRGSNTSESLSWIPILSVRISNWVFIATQYCTKRPGRWWWCIICKAVKSSILDFLIILYHENL